MKQEKLLVAQIVCNNPQNWWSKFYGNMFKVISIRKHSVLVKSNIDEGYTEPYNVHEFPKESIKLIEAVQFP